MYDQIRETIAELATDPRCEMFLDRLRGYPLADVMQSIEDYLVKEEKWT